MRLLFSALLLVPLCSCANLGERLTVLEDTLDGALVAIDNRVDEANQEYWDRIGELQAQLDAGEIDFEAYRDSAASADRYRAKAIEDKVRAVKDEVIATTEEEIETFKKDWEKSKARGAQAVTTGVKVATGMLGLGPWGDIAASLLLGGAGGAAAANRRRRNSERA